MSQASLNGSQAALVAHKTLGKAKGVFGIGNGNPGSTSIDKRQNGSEQGILDYNKANGTNFTVDKFADDEFFDPNSSIQKWSAKLDQYGDELIGMIAVGGPAPLVKAAEGHNIEKGKIVIGTFDARPDVLDLIEQGWVYWGIDQQFPIDGLLRDRGGLVDGSSAATRPRPSGPAAIWSPRTTSPPSKRAPTSGLRSQSSTGI